MVTDPIDVLKRELADISVLLDRLQEAISSSKQEEAARKFKDIKEQLEKVKSKLEEEFKWVAPQEE